ncbi:MAG: hypothetical protein IJI43_00550 [Bacilli bacterium]|nr:hypothetical protein [Bacilli bacterium]
MFSSKNNKNYVDVLGEEGWSKEEITNTFVDKKKVIFFKTALVFMLLLLIIIPISIPTYSKYSTEASSNTSLRTAKWEFNINGDHGDTSIDLEKTITNDYKKVVPGSMGKIDLVINFGGSEVASKYIVTKSDMSLLPDNLKLYTDSNYSNEFDKLTSSVGLNDIDENIVISLYWKWNYTLDDESSWMDKEIKLILDVDLSEDMGDVDE